MDGRISDGWVEGEIDGGKMDGWKEMRCINGKAVIDGW